MQLMRSWWHGSNGPAYKWYKIKRWWYKQLASYGMFKGCCVGCGEPAYNFDSYYEWHICNNCSSDEVAYELSEHVMYPNGRDDSNY